MTKTRRHGFKILEQADGASCIAVVRTDLPVCLSRRALGPYSRTIAVKHDQGRRRIELVGAKTVSG